MYVTFLNGIITFPFCSVNLFLFYFLFLSSLCLNTITELTEDLLMKFKILFIFLLKAAAFWEKSNCVVTA